MRKWDFRQRFEIRFSTLDVGIILIALVSDILPAMIRGERLPTQAFAPQVILFCASIGMILSLAFLLASIFRRNPQLQFLGELLIALISMTLLGRH